MVSTPVEKKRDGWWHTLELIAGIEATTTQKYFLTLVHRHTNWRKGYAWATQSTLAHEMCVNERTAKRVYRWAKKLRVINSKLVRTGKLPQDQHNEYSLNIERLEELQRPPRPTMRQRITPLQDSPQGTPMPPDEQELGTPKSSNKGQSVQELGTNYPRTDDMRGPIGSELRQSMNNSVKQNPSPVSGFGQGQSNLPSQEGEKPDNGRSIIALEKIQPPMQETYASRRVPPVIAYLAKHRRLPPYILDDSQLILDRHGHYAGYIDLNGNRHNIWNEFESIGMAQSRTSHETIAGLAEKLDKFSVQAGDPDLALTGEEKLKMLRNGTNDQSQAESWSLRTGVPAEIYLTRDPEERATLFRRWQQQHAEEAPNLPRERDGRNALRRIEPEI